MFLAEHSPHSLCILRYATDTKAPNGSCEPFSPSPRFMAFVFSDGWLGLAGHDYALSRPFSSLFTVFLFKPVDWVIWVAFRSAQKSLTEPRNFASEIFERWMCLFLSP